MRRKVIPILVGILIVTVIVWQHVQPATTIRTILQRIDYLVYDLELRSQFFKPLEKQSPVVIVDIDEKSLRAEGRWPWPRDRVAILVEQLRNSGALVIAFDMTFTKHEVNLAEKVLSEYIKDDAAIEEISTAIAQLTDEFDNDALFAEQIAMGDVILGVVFNNEDISEGLLPKPLLTIDESIIDELIMTRMTNYRGNAERLQSVTDIAGFITTIPDSDGIIRRSPLLIRYQNGVYPSLALETARQYLLVDNVSLKTAAIGSSLTVEGLKFGKMLIPTDAFGRVLVPYKGRVKSYPYFSATDVLNGKLKPGQLENTLVFIGTTALGLADNVATPFGSVFPGVEVHANIADGIINNNFPYEPAWAPGAELFLILILGIPAALLYPFFHAVFLFSIGVSTLLIILLVDAWMIHSQGLVLSPVLPFLTVLSLATWNMTYGYLFETRRKKLIKHMFGQYVPPQHVEEMTHDPSKYGLGGETKEMSILFADIRSFTSISEQLTAAQVQHLLNEFFTPMTKIIFDSGGTIDKYVGDMIMAFWNAPLADDEHADHAIGAALQMLEATNELKLKFKELGLPEINIGIGINTGEVIVGDMGSEFRRSYTVIGDAVNLASRLESLTKHYGVNMIVCDTTFEGQDPEHFLFRKLDKVKVKGKQQAVTIYQPICLRKEASAEDLQEVQLFETALENYFNQNWQQSQIGFKNLGAKPEYQRLCEIFLERIALYEQKPPAEGWDGSTEMLEK